MYRLSAALAVLLAPTVATAAQDSKDVLAVVLQTNDGRRELRHQPSAPESCRSFLQNFAKARGVDLPVRLTIKAPPEVTGRVLEAWCIRSDGSILKSDGTVVEP